MKKVLLFIMLFFIMPVFVSADQIYEIDMDIQILKDGTAKITEVWDVDATDGTEWYKTMYDLHNSKLSDFEVYMDGRKLMYKENWDVNASFEDKAGYYGINNTSDGIELCFGKYDYNRHTFTLKYKLSNYVFNTRDSQVLYWTLLPKTSVDYFNVDITGYYSFPDTLEVWGYGYKGYAYVKNGKISMSNEDKLNNQYVVLLAKFPKNTFDTSNVMGEYDTFDDVFKVAERNTFKYNYSNFDINEFIGWLVILFPFMMIIIMFFRSFMVATEEQYGFVNNKKINKKDVNMFRDIPCNKDIYYANALIKLNNFGYKKFNILGAIILKWVNLGYIKFKNKKKGIFKKETSVLDLTKDVVFDNPNEEKLFDMMRAASKDGILEARELEKWAKNNYDRFLDIFDNSLNNEISYLKGKQHIYNRTNRKECKRKKVMDDTLYNDSVELYGLKKYLEEFSKVDTKEVMEVKLWGEYLMFAYLFGIADKVAKQLKNLYPDVLLQKNIDYETIEFLDRISYRSVDNAEDAKNYEERKARAREYADSYSSGGGGFSSGGGGSSSSGGGSHGSMGGR